MAGTKWVRTFHAMVATPVGPGDVYLGVVAWTAVRAAIGGTLFLVVATLFGGVLSWWAPLAIPAAALTALAFAAPLTAFAATQETDFRFPVIMRLGVVPLFLFSGHVLPGLAAPGLAPAVLLALAALARRPAVPRPRPPASSTRSKRLANVAILVALVVAGDALGRPHLHPEARAT